jgi:hypothetical protein
VSQPASISTMNPAQLDGPHRTTTLSNADLAAIWAEARIAYPLYAALASEFGLAHLPYSIGELPPARPTRSVFARDLKWLDSIDDRLLAYQLRQVPSQTLHASEPSLRAFIQRQLRKPEKSTVDRDKVDWLLVQYFALCAPAELLREAIRLEDVAGVLRPVLATGDFSNQDWCEPLDKILHRLDGCQSLRDIMENGLLEQGRLLKDSAGASFYAPASLVAFCRFNFLLRRTFIRLLHADLSAIREEIAALEERNVKTVDCRRAGLSAAETTGQLRQFCDNWKQPFQKDYTESSVTRCFEQLLALRTDIEEVLGRFRPALERRSSEPVPGEPAAYTAGPAETPGRAEDKAEKARSMGDPARSAEVGGAAPISRAPNFESVSEAFPTATNEADICRDTILQQLTASPAARGISMSTITLQDTKVMLSSWEGAAFVSKEGQESEDLRRAVVARALLAAGIDRRKRSGEESSLTSALALARREMSYFRDRVEDAKRMRNTEAAVNLGISTKRLLSFIEEAETLQP